MIPADPPFPALPGLAALAVRALWVLAASLLMIRDRRMTELKPSPPMARPSARPLPSGCDPGTRAARLFAEMLSAAAPERRPRRRRRHAFESARLLFSQGAVRGIRHLRPRRSSAGIPGPRIGPAFSNSISGTFFTFFRRASLMASIHPRRPAFRAQPVPRRRPARHEASGKALTAPPPPPVPAHRDTPEARAAAVRHCTDRLPPPPSLDSPEGAHWCLLCAARFARGLGLSPSRLFDILREHASLPQTASLS